MRTMLSYKSISIYVEKYVIHFVHAVRPEMLKCVNKTFRENLIYIRSEYFIKEIFS